MGARSLHPVRVRKETLQRDRTSETVHLYFKHTLVVEFGRRPFGTGSGYPQWPIPRRALISRACLQVQLLPNVPTRREWNPRYPKNLPKGSKRSSKWLGTFTRFISKYGVVGTWLPSSSEVKVRFLKRAKSIRRRFEPFYLDKRYLKGLVQIHKHRGDAPCFLRASRERTFNSAGVIW